MCGWSEDEPGLMMADNKIYYNLKRWELSFQWAHTVIFFHSFSFDVFLFLNLYCFGFAGIFIVWTNFSTHLAKRGKNTTHNSLWIWWSCSHPYHVGFTNETERYRTSIEVLWGKTSIIDWKYMKRKRKKPPFNL